MKKTYMMMLTAALLFGYSSYLAFDEKMIWQGVGLLLLGTAFLFGIPLTMSILAMINAVDGWQEALDIAKARQARIEHLHHMLDEAKERFDVLSQYALKAAGYWEPARMKDVTKDN